MAMLRSLEPEWLDTLPPDDPRAQHSRRDLRRINGLMGSAAFVARELVRGSADGPPRTIAEIGAGDGTLMLRVARRLAAPSGQVRAILVDRQPAVSPRTLAALGALGWRAEATTADVFDWLAAPGGGPFDAIVANLFLHHFEAAPLAALLALAARRTRQFIACEPRRSRIALAGSHLLGLIGCNDVSRHDAVVSVRAGFHGRELSALWPVAGGWVLRERAYGPFGHAFVATMDGDGMAGGAALR